MLRLVNRFIIGHGPSLNFKRCLMSSVYLLHGSFFSLSISGMLLTRYFFIIIEA